MNSVQQMILAEYISILHSARGDNARQAARYECYDYLNDLARVNALTEAARIEIEARLVAPDIIFSPTQIQLAITEALQHAASRPVTA